MNLIYQKSGTMEQLTITNGGVQFVPQLTETLQIGNLSPDNGPLPGSSEQLSPSDGGTSYTLNETHPALLLQPPNSVYDLTVNRIPYGWYNPITASPRKGTFTDDEELIDSKDIFIDWCVYNEAGTITESFQTALFLDDSLVHVWTCSSGLQASDYLIVEDYNLGKISEGMHTLTIITDYSGNIPETDETNNIYTRGLFVAPSAPKDVRIYSSGTLIRQESVINNAVIAEGGDETMHVYSGGIANNTALGSCGYMLISKGGAANDTLVSSDGLMLVYSGGAAHGTVIRSGGNADVVTGGFAADTAVSGAGAVFYVGKTGRSENTSIGTAGTMIVNSNGSAHLTNVGSGGTLLLEDGAIVQDTVLHSGGKLVVSAFDALGEKAVMRGSNSLGGTMTLSDTLLASGATLNFAVDQRKTSDSYIIDDLSLILGAPDYTITVSADQTAGTYKLAAGASAFNGTVTVRDNFGNDWGTLSVDGTLQFGKDKYFSLAKDDGGNLLFHVANTKIPEIDLSFYTPSDWAGPVVLSTAPDVFANSSVIHTSNETYLNFTVANFGSDTSDPVSSYIYIDGVKYDTLITSDGVPGSSYTTFENLALGSFSAGTHTIEIVLDGNDAIAETDENNNRQKITFTVSEEKDTVKPTISAIALAQGAADYTFTLTVSASDDKSAESGLTFQIKYASSREELTNAAAIPGKSFTLADTAAGKSFYCQAGVTDEAGNTAWSEVTSFSVKDVTAPTLNGTPAAKVSGKNVTISWEAAADNAGVAGYHLTVDGKKYTVSGTSHTLTELSEGKHTFSLSAYDAAGNESKSSANQSFTISSSKPETVGSTFKWSGEEYEDVYICINGVTSNDFKKTTSGNGENCYMWTDKKITDAEKSSLTTEDYYIYMNVCWAATVSNMFINTGWADGIFETEDIALKYFCDNYSYVTYNNGYKGVGPGNTFLGADWLLSKDYTYNYDNWDNNNSKPKDEHAGGFYPQIQTDDYLSRSSSNYITCQDLEQAVSTLKNGGAVGLSVGWYNCRYQGEGLATAERGGGHAITIYGFTYDESKAGTYGYFTGIIVADSDDDMGSPDALNEYPPEQAPDRVKILDILPYVVDGEVTYVFQNYGFASYGDSMQVGVIDGFQYLPRCPDDISSTLNSKVSFAKNSNWNASYSVSTSKNNALSGTKQHLTTQDDIFVAVNLNNTGLGKSGNFTITAVIDEKSENALVFNISKELSYGESDDQTVLNLGKLSNGVHEVVLTVTDGDVSDTVEITNVYVAYANVSDNKFTVNSGQMASNTSISADQSQTVQANGSATGATITANGQQIIQADGSSEGTKIYADGLMTVEKGGTAVNAEIFDKGFIVANGSVDKTVVHSGGTLFADRDSHITSTTIEADGWMAVNYRGYAEKTALHGNLLVINGTAKDTTVYADGSFMVLENGFSDGAEILDNALQCVAEGGNASDNTFTGEFSQQYVFNPGSVASGNTFDAGTQFVSDGGTVEDSTFSNSAVQDLQEGAAAFRTTLNSGSIQYIQKAVAYDTVINATGLAFVLEGGLSVNCTVRSSGGIILGDADILAAEGGVGAAKDLTVEYGGFAIMEEGAVLYGTTSVSGTISVRGKVSGGTLNRQDPSPAMFFDFSGRSVSDGAMINDISLLSNFSCSLKVDNDQANGTYKLSAAGGSAFDQSISVYDDEGVYYGTLTVDNMVLMGDQIITLEKNNGALDFTIADSPYSLFELPETQVKTNNGSCSWGRMAGSESYIVQFSKDGFQTCITIETGDNSLSFSNLPFDLQWRIKAKEAAVWTYGTTVKTSTDENTGIVNASQNWEFDVLFASASEEKWSDEFSARHQGIYKGWKGTDEQLSLAGKNRIAHVFEGSTDANVLLLTDDANGDALFTDDIYTAFGDRSRIAKIDEIRAGAGDDIVDMTSQRFTCISSGMTIRGGTGNDTIWANNGQNILCGDAGNDRIVGGSGDDIIAGGIGNDSMHGGGGNDIFTFCGNWGHDTVEQLQGGSVTLWFAEGSEENWDAEKRIYTDGGNSVTVSGVTEITLKFGDISQLGAASAFEEESSRQIFEENKGMLA